MKFRYPKPLKIGSTIAVTAPSSGVGQFSARYKLVKESLEQASYRILEGKCLHQDEKHVSGTAKERAQDFMELWCNPEVSAIIPPWGGEQLIGILEHLDFDVLNSAEPKWCMGYSDISLLLSVITCTTGVVTVHGTNLMEMLSTQTDALTKNALEPLKLSDGESIVQNSATQFKKDRGDYLNQPEAPMKYTEPVKWKTPLGDSLELSGRMIGGCVDVLMAIAGTRFDKLNSFKAMAGADGVVLYLENCELSTNHLLRAFYEFKYTGWLDGLNGVVLGRNSGPDSETQPYEEMITEFFNELSLPLIYDVDIGHRQPNLSILNGALSTITCSQDGSGSLTSVRD
ncbi:MAG: LD-carboxypeptidase [Bdellovibrionota bacterium]